jgi:hypothetical protein
MKGIGGSAMKTVSWKWTCNICEREESTQEEGPPAGWMRLDARRLGFGMLDFCSLDCLRKWAETCEQDRLRKWADTCEQDRPVCAADHIVEYQSGAWDEVARQNL